MVNKHEYVYNTSEVIQHQTSQSLILQHITSSIDWHVIHTSIITFHHTVRVVSNVIHVSSTYDQNTTGYMVYHAAFSHLSQVNYQHFMDHDAILSHYITVKGVNSEACAQSRFEVEMDALLTQKFHSCVVWWCMVRASDSWPELDSQPLHLQVMTSGKLFTHMWLCHQAV